MSWQRTRQLLSGALVLAALVLGGVVGNVLLLGRVDHGDGGIGQLSARVSLPVAPATTVAPTTTVVTATTITPVQTVTAQPRPGEESAAGDRGARDEREADD